MQYYLLYYYGLLYLRENVFIVTSDRRQGSYAAWKSLNSMEFHLLKIKALKAWNSIN